MENKPKNWPFLIITILLIVQTISFAVLYYKINQSNLAHFEYIAAHMVHLENTLAHHQQLIDLNFNNLQNQQLHIQLLAQKSSLSSGLYHGDNQFLQIVTSKPVLIASGVIIGLVVLYAVLNNLNHNNTINDNLGNFSTEIHDKVGKVNSNLNEHAASLHENISTVNSNVQAVNTNLCTLEDLVSKQKINLEAKIQTSKDDVIHQIISFFQRKFFPYNDFPSAFGTPKTESLVLNNYAERIANLGPQTSSISDIPSAATSNLVTTMSTEAVIATANTDVYESLELIAQTIIG